MYSPQFTTFYCRVALYSACCVYLSASHTCSTDVTLHAPTASFGRQRLDHKALDLNFFAWKSFKLDFLFGSNEQM